MNVVIPEVFEKRSLPSALRATNAFRLEAALHHQPGVVVTHVPVLASAPRLAPELPPKTETLVLVPNADDATAEAVRYARALGAARTRAAHVALDPDRTDSLRREWEERRMPVPLEVIDAPFRSLEAPVLETVRSITATPGMMAAVVVPELASGSWWQDLLPNEWVLYLEWLLRFEPRVLLSPVPLHRSL